MPDITEKESLILKSADRVGTNLMTSLSLWSLTGSLSMNNIPLNSRLILDKEQNMELVDFLVVAGFNKHQVENNRIYATM